MDWPSDSSTRFLWAARHLVGIVCFSISFRLSSYGRTGHFVLFWYSRRGWWTPLVAVSTSQCHLACARVYPLRFSFWTSPHQRKKKEENSNLRHDDCHSQRAALTSFNDSALTVIHHPHFEIQMVAEWWTISIELCHLLVYMERVIIIKARRKKKKKKKVHTCSTCWEKRNLIIRTYSYFSSGFN